MSQGRSKTCPLCGAERPSRELWCEACGADLSRVPLLPMRAAREAVAREMPERREEPVKLCSCGAQNHVQARRCMSCRADIALFPHLRREETQFALLCADGTPPHPVGQRETHLGRMAEPVASLPDNRFVSRRHALLEWLDGALFLTDEGSVNGTFVQGERLTPGAPRRLRPGDRISLGGLWEGEARQAGAAHFIVREIGGEKPC